MNPPDRKADAERFLRDYLAEKLRLQKLWAVANAPIQEKFFAPGYSPNDFEERIRVTQAETVLGAVEQPGAWEITTTGGGKHHRLRYRVTELRGEFRIGLLEMQCSACSRAGNTRADCRLCIGHGWIGLPIKSPGV